MRETPPATDTTPIRFSGRLDQALYRRAARLALRGVLPVGLVWALVAMALAAGIVGAFVLGQVVAGALATSLGLLGAFALVLHETAARRAWRSHGATEAPVEGELDEAAFRLRSPRAEVEVPWDRVQAARSTRGLLLLYPSPRRFHVLAAEFFATPAEWRAARALVARKIASSERGDRRRLVWIFLASFLLFLAVTIAWTVWRAP